MTGAEIAVALYVVGQGLKLGSSVAGNIKRQGRMEEQEIENKRAEARAGLISSLTGQHQQVMPNIVMPGRWEQAADFGSQLGGTVSSVASAFMGRK